MNIKLISGRWKPGYRVMLRNQRISGLANNQAGQRRSHPNDLMHPNNAIILVLTEVGVLSHTIPSLSLA